MGPIAPLGEERDPAVEAVLDKINEGKYKLVDMFQRMDSDGNGVLDKGELKAALEKLGVKVSPGVLDKIFAKIDSNSDGGVEVSEFLNRMRTIQLERRRRQGAEEAMSARAAPGVSPGASPRRRRVQTSHRQRLHRALQQDDVEAVGAAMAAAPSSSLSRSAEADMLRWSVRRREHWDLIDSTNAVAKQQLQCVRELQRHAWAQTAASGLLQPTGPRGENVRRCVLGVPDESHTVNTVFRAEMLASTYGGTVVDPIATARRRNTRSDMQPRSDVGTPLRTLGMDNTTALERVHALMEQCRLGTLTREALGDELANNWAHIEASWMRTIMKEFELLGGTELPACQYHDILHAAAADRDRRPLSSAPSEDVGQRAARQERVYISALSPMVERIRLDRKGKDGAIIRPRKPRWTLRTCRNVGSRAYIPPLPLRLQGPDDERAEDERLRQWREDHTTPTGY